MAAAQVSPEFANYVQRAVFTMRGRHEHDRDNPDDLMAKQGTFENPDPTYNQKLSHLLLQAIPSEVKNPTWTTRNLKWEYTVLTFYRKCGHS